MTTVFEMIIAGQIPCEKVYETENILAIKDIHPQAPIHILIMPKKHIRDLQSVKAEDIHLIGEVVQVAQEIAKAQGITDYRLVSNNGSGVGQTQFHLHFHLLAGKSMQENLI